VNHIPESPPECEALLAEALEALAKFPGWTTADNIDAWHRERALPTIAMIEAFLYPDSVAPST
jgi:hypothetical protein